MRRRGAFSLIEMLVVVALLSVFMLVSMSLFRSLMGWMGAGARASAERRVLGEAVQQMRADVWSAYEVAVGDANTALLRAAGEQTITWRVMTDADTGDRVLRRTSWRSPGGVEELQPGAQARQVTTRQWSIRPGSVAFEKRAGGMTLVQLVARGDARAATDRRATGLYSQVILNRGSE